MSVGEHYVLKLFGELLGEDVLNVFTYRQSAAGTGAPAAELALRFDDVVLSQLVGAVGDHQHYPRTETFSIETPSDYNDREPGNNQGDRVFTPSGISASWVAFGLRSNRAGAGTRASYKRFSGIGEADLIGNGLEASFLALTPVIALETNLAAILVSGSGDVFVPVQLKSGWVLGEPATENFVINNYNTPYLTSQVSRRP